MSRNQLNQKFKLMVEAPKYVIYFNIIYLMHLNPTSHLYLGIKILIWMRILIIHAYFIFLSLTWLGIVPFDHHIRKYLSSSYSAYLAHKKLWSGSGEGRKAKTHTHKGERGQERIRKVSTTNRTEWSWYHDSRQL